MSAARTSDKLVYISGINSLDKNVVPSEDQRNLPLIALCLGLQHHEECFDDVESLNSLFTLGEQIGNTQGALEIILAEHLGNILLDRQYQIILHPDGHGPKKRRSMRVGSRKGNPGCNPNDSQQSRPRRERRNTLSQSRSASFFAVV